MVSPSSFNRSLRGQKGRPSRRLWLALAATTVVGLAFAPSCAAPFDPPSKVDSLRVFSVDADKPYANPGDTVTFKLNFSDSLDRENQRAIQITWLGGCFDPDGDAYYGCYTTLAETLKQIAAGEIPPDGVVAEGPDLDTFQTTLPMDIVSRRPKPTIGPYNGSAFVFFAACAGTVKPIPQEGSSTAGSFPLGCFDDQGNRLGPDSFVAGYTEVYAFDDGRTNANPTITELDLDGAAISTDFASAPTVDRCDVTEDERRVTGCAASTAYKSCTKHRVKVIVPHDVAEVDPDAKSATGGTLREVVWASYFADGGDFDADTKLISDATSGYSDTQEVNWDAPPDPGTYTIWVVVHDSRGGSTTEQRLVNVK